jgi:hypothetical protein
VKRFISGDLGVTVLSGVQTETEAESMFSIINFIVLFKGFSLVQFRQSLVLSLFFLYFTSAIETGSLLWSTVIR